MAVEAGTRLGRFVVHEYIGQGTLGTVYRAVDPEAGIVAVKVLHRLSEPESRERFEELAPRLLEVRHPGLVPALDHGEHEDVPYLVEEHVDAITLAERFRRATVNPAAAVEILRGMAAAIDHAHAGGLVHGNLKPAQVLLRAGDLPLVSDFGLAPLRRPRLAGLAVGFRDGTPEYLAPEQVVGGEPTDGTDRYAFAAIAYQLLVDRPPFEGEPQSVMNAQLRSEPVAPSRRNRALPGAVDGVLLRGLAKDQAARWLTCEELVAALARALGMVPEIGVETPARPRARRWPLVAAGLATVAAASLVAGLVLAGSRGHGQVPVGVSASRLSVHAGETVTIDASHLPANQLGTVQSGPVTLGEFQADRNGKARAHVRIPDGTSPGSHVVSLCWRDACPAAVDVHVERTATATPAPAVSPTATPAQRATSSPSARPARSPSAPAAASASATPR
jgi:serine/threonine-protein kinase